MNNLTYLPKSCVITGHTSGLGKSIAEHFTRLGWNVIGFNTETGLEKVVETADGCDLFINNAYADGIQITLLNKLHNKVEKMIVCGSVVTDHPDPELVTYSKHKQELESRALELTSNILLLKLSGNAYNDPPSVIKAIEFWLENPTVNVIAFKVIGDPNR